MRWKLLGLGFAGFGLLSAAVYAQAGINGVRVAELLKTRLPETQVTSVDCAKVNGVCEVVAGKAVFYTDSGARYLFVGRLYDMETRQDLTAARLLEINPDTLIGGAGQVDAEEGREEAAQLVPAGAAQRPRAGAGQAVTGGASASVAAAQRASLTRIDLSPLPASGAISWGKPAGRPVTIFTDFRCGYCRALVATLEQMNVRVIERPISILGSRDIANRVYCAKDRSRAVREAYAGIEVEAASCDTSGLDANERFAREHGFSGTPIIVRSDGAVLEGYRPRQVLEQWLSAI